MHIDIVDIAVGHCWARFVLREMDVEDDEAVWYVVKFRLPVTVEFACSPVPSSPRYKPNGFSRKHVSAQWRACAGAKEFGP